jgi:hypothetical protein
MTSFALLYETSTIENGASRADSGPVYFRLDLLKLIDDLLWPPPCVLLPKPDDLGLYLGRGAVRTRMRCTASVAKALESFFQIPLHPFVASLSTHSKVLT